MAITTDRTAWDDADELDGVELIDKAELVGKRFLMTEIWFEAGSNGIEYAYVSGQMEDGTPFTFTDSSTTGIKRQLTDHLACKNEGHLPPQGESVQVRLVAPRGLRVSQYEVQNHGKVKQAKTYYLTTSGRRAKA